MKKEIIKETLKGLRNCLKYCREQNGRDDCKNCGLCPEDLDKLASALKQNKCTCNFSDETAAEIGHYPECPMVNKDLRHKRETKPVNEKDFVK